MRRVFSQSLAPACAKPLRRRQGGTFGSLLQTFLGKTGTSRKVRSSVTLDFQKIRNCKGLGVPLPGFDVATHGLMHGRGHLKDWQIHCNDNPSDHHPQKDHQERFEEGGQIAYGHIDLVVIEIRNFCQHGIQGAS